MEQARGEAKGGVVSLPCARLRRLDGDPAGGRVDLGGSVATGDLHWVIGLGALNLGGTKSNRQTDRYVLDARYRF